MTEDIIYALEDPKVTFQILLGFSKAFESHINDYYKNGTPYL